MAEKKLQTEMVGLPSKGLLYPESSPLRSGAIEVKYMTAKEEDILTNQTYIKSGVVKHIMRTVPIDPCRHQ